MLLPITCECSDNARVLKDKHAPIPGKVGVVTGGGSGHAFSEALEAMKVAAEKGKESTIDLVAKIGRASRLGERSRGVLDAGATSCYLILTAMADTLMPLGK